MFFTPTLFLLALTKIYGEATPSELCRLKKPAPPPAPAAPVPGGGPPLPGTDNSTPAPGSDITPSSIQPNGNTGYCYEPYHDGRFPMAGKGSPNEIQAIIDQDFKLLSQEVKIIRTYMSHYFGKEFVSIAAKYGIQLYLGIQMFPDPQMYKDQINAAIAAVRNHPNTILAVVLGSENLTGNGGPFSPQALIDQIQHVRSAFSGAGVKPPRVATSQRINEWLSHDPMMQALANVVDIMGVNIYPFFTNGWNPAKPTDLLEAQLNQLRQVHSMHMHKVVITESGWPTAGAPPPGLPNNIPSVANAKAYYYGFMQWNSPILHFWFLSHDRRLDDNASKIASFEAYFGRYTANGQKKY